MKNPFGELTQNEVEQLETIRSMPPHFLAYIWSQKAALVGEEVVKNAFLKQKQFTRNVDNVGFLIKLTVPFVGTLGTLALMPKLEEPTLFIVSCITATFLTLTTWPILTRFFSRINARAILEHFAWMTDNIDTENCEICEIREFCPTRHDKHDTPDTVSFKFMERD